MLSFTRWTLVMLIVVAAAVGGSLLEAPRLLVPASRDDAGVHAASSTHAVRGLPDIAFAKGQQPVGRRELPLRPVDIRLSPTSQFDARGVASSTDDPREAFAPHIHDATGPPLRS